MDLLIKALGQCLSTFKSLKKHLREKISEKVTV